MSKQLFAGLLAQHLAQQRASERTSRLSGASFSSPLCASSS